MSLVRDHDGGGGLIVELCPVTASMVRDYAHEAMQQGIGEDDPLEVVEYVVTKLYCLEDDKPSQVELELVAKEVADVLES